MTAHSELAAEHVAAGLAYHAAGNGPAVVLLHGWANSWHIWKDTMPVLVQAGYRVYAPDLVGCGHSSKPVLWYTPADYLRYLERWLDELELKSFVLCGHSLGGHLALSYVLRHPQRVGKLIVIGPAFGAVSQMTPTAAQLLLTVAGLPGLGELALMLTPHRLLRWALLRRNGGLYGPERIPKDVIERLVVDFLDNASPLVCNTIRYLVVFSLPGLRRLKPDADLRPYLHRISTPTLVVWGRHDALLAPASFERLVAALPNGVACPLADAGHSPQIEAPTDFQRALLAFLAEP